MANGSGEPYSADNYADAAVLLDKVFSDVSTAPRGSSGF